MPTPYPDPIPQIAKVLLEEIEKHFPELTKKNFNGFGETCEEGSSAQIRAEFCIYFELMKAGAFDNYFTEDNQ